MGRTLAYDQIHQGQLEKTVEALHGDAVAASVFAGLIRPSGKLQLLAFAGTRTNSLFGVEVDNNTGLGGRVLATGGVHAVQDYLRAPSITHDYDRAVSPEGFRAVLALPVKTDGRAVAVIYCASRAPGRLADAAIEAAANAARGLGDRMAGIDLALGLARGPGGHETEETNERQEQRRRAYGELRALTEQIEERALRQRFHAALARAEGPPSRPVTPTPSSIRLSQREVDVLSQVAVAATNQQIADAFGIRPETVKSYLSSAFNKLDARSRMEAVIKARAAGFLP